MNTIYIHIHANRNRNMNTHLHIHVYIYMCMYIYICIYMYMYIYIYMYNYVYNDIYIHMQTCIPSLYIFMYIDIQECSSPHIRIMALHVSQEKHAKSLKTQ